MDKFVIRLPAKKENERQQQSVQVELELDDDCEMLNGLREPGWRRALAPELLKPYFREIRSFVRARRRQVNVYPAADKVFEAFNLTPLDHVKVVIIGQDPYIRPGQAHGLSFSVMPGVAVPPSLRNIYKELASDIDGFVVPEHGYLIEWARQGVLLLNAALTVDEGASNSHAKRVQWHRFTDAVIALLNRRAERIVFVLWGGFAQKKGRVVDRRRHAVVQCCHPSPLSATKWWGTKSFSKINALLRNFDKPPINWQLSVRANQIAPNDNDSSLTSTRHGDRERVASSSSSSSSSTKNDDDDDISDFDDDDQTVVLAHVDAKEKENQTLAPTKSNDDDDDTIGFDEYVQKKNNDDDTNNNDDNGDNGTPGRIVDLTAPLPATRASAARSNESTNNDQQSPRAKRQRRH
jgi:uracil-DNA glycosylase